MDSTACTRRVPKSHTDPRGHKRSPWLHLLFTVFPKHPGDIKSFPLASPIDKSLSCPWVSSTESRRRRAKAVLLIQPRADLCTGGQDLQNSDTPDFDNVLQFLTGQPDPVHTSGNECFSSQSHPPPQRSLRLSLSLSKQVWRFCSLLVPWLQNIWLLLGSWQIQNQTPVCQICTAVCVTHDPSAMHITCHCQLLYSVSFGRGAIRWEKEATAKF